MILDSGAQSLDSLRGANPPPPLCDAVAGCGEHLPAWGLRDDIPGTDQAVRGGRHGQKLHSGFPPSRASLESSKTKGGGPLPQTPLPPPQTKVTIAGKNEIYNRETLVRPFLVHQVLGPKPPPPLPPPFSKEALPPRQGDARSSTDACLSWQKVQGREANRRRHRLTEPTTKALCQPPRPPCGRTLMRVRWQTPGARPDVPAVGRLVGCVRGSPSVPIVSGVLRGCQGQSSPVTTRVPLVPGRAAVGHTDRPCRGVGGGAGHERVCGPRHPDRQRSALGPLNGTGALAVGPGPQRRPQKRLGWRLGAVAVSYNCH